MAHVARAEGGGTSGSSLNRRSFPTGQTSTALVKALLRTLGDEKGTGAAETWLRELGMVRDDLEDETRMVPLPTLHRALVRFAERASREAIPRAWKHLIDPDNLGIWVRVVRGTRSPAEAFARLDAADSEYARTTRWETIAFRRGWWHGRVVLAHDPSLESDGLLRLARVAELCAVPALFGWPDAAVTDRTESEPRAPGLVQEYEVSWSLPSSTLSGAIGAIGGAVLAGIAAAETSTALALKAAAVGVAAAVGGLLGIVRARDRLRRAETSAQALRVSTLERSLSLRESHDHDVPGQLEGSVAAGQYRILRRMGAGATGVIYEALRIADGMPVALKLLRAAAAHEAVASDRLRREAGALGLSWHPNVVEVIDHGHLPDGTAYLVMELLHGESLATRLRAKGRLTPAELLPIAMQVCDALAAVHAAGVVHRDLKPSNIYVVIDRDRPAGPERVKLLDFGIARVEWEETRITNTGGPLGTLGYMSPEQENGAGEIDGRSDLFALGAMLFECLVGEPPPPQSPSGLVRTGENHALRFDSCTQKAAALVPPSWRAIIEKAMETRPSERFQDARSFAQALRGIRDADVGAATSH
ncbi:MAG: serine/threonine protein kinase [Myxococcota bacterium]|nr:serine/threonine protein kinase [Myxococcota bacterium]